MERNQLEGRTKVVALDDGTFFIPIPGQFLDLLHLKEGDEVNIHECIISYPNIEQIGFTICKVQYESE